MNNTAYLDSDLPGVRLDRAFELVSAMPFGQPQATPATAIARSRWTLELIAAGSLSVRFSSGLWQTIHRRQGILYGPGTTSWERNDRAYQSLYLLFDVHRSPATDAWEAFFCPGRIIQDPQDLLLPLVEQAVRHHSLSGADALLARAAFLQVVARLLQARQEAGALIVLELREQDDLIARAHHFMRANLHRPIAVPDLAREAMLSPSGFAHAYKRLAGEAPMIKLRKLRVEAARAYLVSGRHSLKEIARLTGFADAFHLSRTFKAMTGHSPRDFRNRL